MITSETLTAANEHLDTIEAEYDVSIALAVAHGSHAWGLDNENSDYDIKAIYVPNSLNQYAHISSHNKTINRTFGNFEIESWDIQKFASLLSESNEQALDVLRSPSSIKPHSIGPLSENLSKNPTIPFNCTTAIDPSRRTTTANTFPIT